MHWVWPWTFYIRLTATGETEFWVAVGTIALAVATAGMIFQNRRDNRQRFTPILCIQKEEEEVGIGPVSGILLTNLVVSNRGVGPALHISVSLRGAYDDEKLEYDDSLAVAVGAGEHVRISAARIRKKRTLGFKPEQFETSLVRLTYQDIFGKHFHTLYTNLRQGHYEWGPSQNNLGRQTVTEDGLDLKKSDADAPKPPETTSSEAHELLVADFEQSYEQLRHYDDALRKTTEFGFGATATVLAACAAIIGQYALTTFTATVVAALLLISAIAGMLLLFALAQSRVYFVRVARFVNEVRSHYLPTKPLGVENRAGMYVDAKYPPVLHPTSSHTMAVYFFSLCNALLGIVGLVAVRNVFILADHGQPFVPWGWGSLGLAVLVSVEVGLVMAFWKRAR